MNKDTKLTLADLVAKKAAKEAQEHKTVDIFINSLEGEITLHNPKKNIVYKAMDMMGEDKATAENVYANAFLVYNSVKMFQDPELLLAYEVKDNVDIVGMLLEPFEINEVASKVLEISGFSKATKVQENLKN